MYWRRTLIEHILVFQIVTLLRQIVVVAFVHVMMIDYYLLLLFVKVVMMLWDLNELSDVDSFHSCWDVNSVVYA